MSLLRLNTYALMAGRSQMAINLLGRGIALAYWAEALHWRYASKAKRRAYNMCIHCIVFPVRGHVITCNYSIDSHRRKVIFSIIVTVHIIKTIKSRNAHFFIRCILGVARANSVFYVPRLVESPTNYTKIRLHYSAFASAISVQWH